MYTDKLIWFVFFAFYSLMFLCFTLKTAHTAAPPNSHGNKLVMSIPWNHMFLHPTIKIHSLKERKAKKSKAGQCKNCNHSHPFQHCLPSLSAALCQHDLGEEHSRFPFLLSPPTNYLTTENYQVSQTKSHF